MIDPYEPPRNPEEVELAAENPVQWMLDRITEAVQVDVVAANAIKTVMSIYPGEDPEKHLEDFYIVLAFTALKMADFRLKELIKINNINVHPPIIMPGSKLN